MKKLNSKGFGIVEILLVILLVFLVGGIGYYVYTQAKNNDETSTPSSDVSGKIDKEVEPDLAAKDETANWLLYEPPGKEYKIRLADGWQLHRFQENSGIFAFTMKDLAYKKGTKATVVEEMGGRDGSVSFSLYFGNSSLGYLEGATRVDSFITAEGVAVEKYYYKQVKDSEGPGLPKNGEENIYVIKSGKKVTVITHSILPGETAQTDIVEKVVKTLHIN